VLEWLLVGAKVVLMAVVDDVPDDVEMQVERAEFLVSKIINNDADEQKDLDDDELFDIDEPIVRQSDPGLRSQDEEEKEGEGGDSKKDA